MRVGRGGMPLSRHACLFVDLFRATSSVPCSSSSNNPPSDFICHFSSDSSCSLALIDFDFRPSGVRDFRTLPPDFVAWIIVSLVLARTAAASASASSSSEATSTQPTHFDLPFFLGVAFLIAIPFFLADLVVLGSFFAAAFVLGGVDGRHVGQNHSPGKEAAVTRAHSQWYHFIGQLELSQQIQFSELSGRPQVQV